MKIKEVENNGSKKVENQTEERPNENNNGENQNSENTKNQNSENTENQNSENTENQNSENTENRNSTESQSPEGSEQSQKPENTENTQNAGGADETKNEFKKMMDEFGSDIAAKIFADGGTYADAQKAYFAKLRQENETLRKKITDMDGTGGQAAEFSDTTGEDPRDAALRDKLAPNVGDAAANFAASLKMRSN